MIRKAKIIDIPNICKLLNIVNDVHANLRPDIFIIGKRKYTEKELESIINDNTKPIFVYVMDEKVVGYVFTIIKEIMGNNLLPRTELYIDDLCVDREYQNKGIGRKLIEYVIEFGKENKIDSITLNVWNGNDSANHLYQELGFKPRKVNMEKIIK